jgi:hypothetical protein
MVAMVVTLVVSGAIFGLLTAGGNAFRREPEVADRQQNIRVAMDAIMRDVQNAGSGMPLVSQVFTQSDTPLTAGPTGFGAPYLNGQGPQGVMGAAGMALRGGAPTGSGADGSDNSDVLEILIADASCPMFQVCAPVATLNGTVAANVSVRETIPANGCMLAPGTVGTTGLVLLTDSRLFTIQPATLAANGTGCGAATAINGTVNLAAALPQWPTGTPAVTLAATGGVQALMYQAHVVRYMIAPGLDPLDPSPSLWRSDTGRYTPQGAASVAPALGAQNWQVIARGIEDLQVEYLNGTQLWSNNPGVVNVCPTSPPGCGVGDYNNVVRRVRVTLSARTMAPQLQGQTIPAGGGAPNAVRGQLVAIGSPRSAVLGLSADQVSQVSQFQ